MKHETKTLLGAGLTAIGVMYFLKTDNKIDVKEKQTIGGKTLALIPIAVGLYMIFNKQK